MKKTVCFVSKGGPHLASHRMRAEVPSRLINENYEAISFVSSSAKPSCDINVFSKHFSPEEMIKEAIDCKEAGSRVVYDICDNHFNRDARNVYLTMCQIADNITCNTPNMQDTILRYTGKKAEIVNDPITFPYGLPEPNRTSTPKVLWFGHGSNLPALERFLKGDISNLKNLTVISNAPLDDNLGFVKEIPWNLGVVENEIKNYDIVIIPTQGLRYWINEKSPNRAVDSIFAGKFVITDNESIYGPLSPYIYLGDINQGLKYYVDHLDDVYDRIKAGQEFVTKNYNHEEIYRQWKTALSLT